MKKFFKISGLIIGGTVVVLLIAGVVLYILAPHPPKPPESMTSISELEAYLNELVETGDPPGMSVAVVKDGEVVYSQAFGLADGPKNIPATPKTVYQWWSMTKIPTAVAILQLQEQGKLNIDDPVKDYLPFFEVQYPSDNSEVVTIRHLLNHSSGLPNNVPAIIGWIHGEGDPHVNQTALLKEKLPDYAELKFEPGSKAVYTNIGYMVLAAVIEAVTGQTYEDYVIEYIIQPLKMANTNFVYTEEMALHEAAGSHALISILTPFVFLFVEDRNSLIRETVKRHWWFNRIYSDQNGPTGLIGPAADVARLVTAFLNQGELDGARILTPESVAMMIDKERLIQASGMESSQGQKQGLGWKVFPEGNRLYFQHGGGGPGFKLLMRLYPAEGLGIVVMANGTENPVKNDLFDIMADLPW